MRTLTFVVNGQKVDKKGNFDGIVSGTKNYLKCKFEFSSDWNGCVIVAEFSNRGKKYPVQVVNGYCDVPDEATDGSYIWFSLIGLRRDGYRITTSNIRIKQGG